MSSFNVSETIDKKKYTDHKWGQDTQDTTGSQSGSKRAVFDSPEARDTLGYLQDRSPATSAYTDPTAKIYNRLGGMSGDQRNPYVEALIADENKVSETGLNSNLAKTRAGAYRGGTGANMYAQDKVIADYQAQRSTANNSLRYGAYDDAQNRALSANIAGGAGLAALRESDIAQALQQKGFATQLLALLRGEDVESDETQNVSRQFTQGASGRSSGKTTSGSYSYGGGGGGG